MSGHEIPTKVNKSTDVGTLAVISVGEGTRQGRAPDPVSNQAAV